MLEHTCNRSMAERPNACLTATVVRSRSVPVFRDIGAGDTAAIQDLRARKDQGVFKQSYTAKVAAHGVVMLRVK